MENNVLIGQMVLRKNQSEACTHQDSSAILGLKVIGGKMKEAGRLGAFISKVKRGSIADTVGHLRAGQSVYHQALKIEGTIMNQSFYTLNTKHCGPPESRSVSVPSGFED